MTATGWKGRYIKVSTSVDQHPSAFAHHLAAQSARSEKVKLRRHCDLLEEIVCVQEAGFRVVHGRRVEGEIGMVRNGFAGGSCDRVEFTQLSLSREDGVSAATQPLSHQADPHDQRLILSAAIWR